MNRETGWTLTNVLIALVLAIALLALAYVTDTPVRDELIELQPEAVAQ
jgi:Tfp pilus assembly protein PilV